VRELRNVAERIAVMHSGGSMDRAALAALMNMGADASAGAPPAAPQALILDGIMEQNLQDAKRAFERSYLEFQFARHNGVIARTAEAIGIYPSNLHTKLKNYGILT